MIRRLFAAMALSTLQCVSSVAAEPSFRFLDVALIKAGHHGEGASVRGSGTVGEHSVLHGNLDVYDYYNGGLLVSSFGWGTHWSVAPSVSALAGLSADIFGGSYDDHHGGGVEGLLLGVGAGALLRGRTGDRLELEAGLKYLHVVNESASGKLLASATVRYDLSPRMAMGLEVGNDYFGMRAGVAFRFSFRRR